MYLYRLDSIRLMPSHPSILTTRFYVYLSLTHSRDAKEAWPRTRRQARVCCLYSTLLNHVRDETIYEVTCLK